MSYNYELQSNNEELQAILEQVNALPEAGTGGSDGFSPIATVTQTDTGAVIEITDKYGKTEATITNGKDGKDGVDGAAGKTPVKGTDYWTESDKQEMVDYCRDELANAAVEVINIKEKYGLDNTGSTDCSTLINKAIAEAAKGTTLYLPNGTYRLNSTVIVNKSLNIDFNGTIKYYGTDFAFLFKNFNYSTAKFDTIRTSSGSCIKLFSDWTNEQNFIQYSRFNFQTLASRARTESDNGGYCIFVDSVNGWVNENRFTGGQMTGGYGVYVDCLGNNNFNGNLFDSCGVENIGTGFYLANNCRNNMIFRCRHSENFEKFLHTVGVCYGLKVISAAPFNINDNDISDGTTGFVIASLAGTDGSLRDTKGNFVRGTVVCEKHDNTKILANEPAGVFDMTSRLGYEDEYDCFIVGGNSTGVKLNKKYGYPGGINEFSVKFTSANTETFSISDYSGSQLEYTIPKTAKSVVRFSWSAETGWQWIYEFSDANQIKEIISITDYVRNGEVVKTVNNTSPDENGNVEIVVVQEDPIVVGSIDECADTTKKYVLPDGYIYAYRKRFYAGATTPNFTNQLPISQSPSMDGSIYNGIGYKYEHNLYLDPDKTPPIVEVADDIYNANVYQSGLIPVKIGDVVRVNRVGCHTSQGERHSLFRFYRESLQYSFTMYYMNDKLAPIISGGGSYTESGTGNNKIISDIVIHVNSDTLGWFVNAPIGWFTCCFQDTTPPEEVVITVNEEITYTVTQDRYEWSWENTGELYTKPDYLAMIEDLQRQIDELKNA